MCIICNLDEDPWLASDFLNNYMTARAVMQKAADNMLECSKLDSKYDKTHKEMVRLIRAWNQIEHTREKQA